MEQIAVLSLLGIYGVEDMRKKNISVRYLPIFALLGIGLWIFRREPGVLDILLGIGVGAGVMILSLLTRGSIGMGDGMLLSVSGIFLGGGNYKLFLYGLCYAAIYSLGIFLLKKRKGKKEIPFVPFLFLGYLTILAEAAV